VTVGDGLDPETPDERAAEAAAWLLRLSEAALGQQLALHQDFVRWRDADPRHGASFARMERAWHASAVDREAPELAALLTEARLTLDRLRHDEANKRFRRRALAGGLGAAAAISIAVLGYVFWPADTETYQTAVDEIRTIQLADHSVVQIDAASLIAVSFSPHQRLVHIQSGQAYFQVAHDRNRPFIVESHGRSVTATGTAFDVETLAKGLHVTLVEGHVVVRAGTDGPVLAKLEPGDALSTETGTAARLEHGTNLLSLLAWRSGRLVFDDEPLPQVVNTMGRYVAMKVAVDPSAAQLRISGVFVARDLSGLILALERSDGIRARIDQDGTIHLARVP
jgi:transmembrane sensor